VAFPKYLNRSRMFLKWELETVVVTAFSALIPIVIGIVTTYVMLGIFIALIIGYFVIGNYEKYSKDLPPNILKHYLYEVGLQNFNSDNNQKNNFVLPPGYVNEYIE